MGEKTRNYQKSIALFDEALRYIPGGVNSPVRAFRSVGMKPLYIDHGKGSHIVDADGNEYIDYISSWGPLILGHANPVVQEAINEEIKKGSSYGACNVHEVEMARLICQFFPSIEKVRMVNSGTEATMSAVRLARGYTGRNRIIKFEGCYHGHADTFLIEAGSGLATYGNRSSSGVSPDTVENTLVANFNEIDSVKALLDRFEGEVAAVILEPIMGNMGLIMPQEGFLKELRQLTEDRGVVLIFDEVISGFRAARGGAQELFGIQPDLTCLGKIIGGGLPVGAFGGKAEIMDFLSPLGPVYQAGTLSGNPLAMAAGIAMLKQLSEAGFYERLEAIGSAFEVLMLEAIAPYNDRLSFNRCGSLCTLFFKGGGVHSSQESKESDTALYAFYFREMLSRGIYLPPSQFECMFLGMAHSHDDLMQTAQAARESLDIVMRMED